MNKDELMKVVDDRFGGILLTGTHSPDGKACILEACSQAVGKEWTDSPDSLRIWDIRPLNDIQIDNETRTELLVPLAVAYMGCRDWPAKKQTRIATTIAIETVRQIISCLPGLSDGIREKCRTAKTLRAAARAAYAADAADAAARAAYAADAAARAAAAADAAARAAAAAAAAGVLRKAVTIWMEAARDRGNEDE